MGTSILLNVEHVHFAANDEFFDGLDDLWAHHPYTAARQPTTTGPLAGPLERVARVLPLSFSALWMDGSAPAQLALRERPELLALARELPHDVELGACARDGSFADAFDVLLARVG